MKVDEKLLERKWHVIYTKSKWEKKTADVLMQHGVESWCPVQKKKDNGLIVKKL